jgi:hypothetical protein
LFIFNPVINLCQIFTVNFSVLKKIKLSNFINLKKSILTVLYLFILITLFFNYSYSESNSKNLKLSNSTVNSFYDYISSHRKPLDKFLVTLDGTGSFVWICPTTLCLPTMKSHYFSLCSKSNDNKKCMLFAMKRKIKLIKSDKMPTNLRKFKQSDSLNEVINKLKKLDLID